MKGSGIANFKRELLILTGHFCVRANLLDIQSEKGVLYRSLEVKRENELSWP